ncbi:MAG: TetR/AcrR family transcriptional regulator [Steroidobacteraceae bacterium]
MRAKTVSLANSAWGKKPVRTRGPKSTLSADQIAQVAIRLADAEGLAAVTMQRLARELGLTTMAIYRYFRAKADLVALMIDSASDSPLHFDKSLLPWNRRLQEWAHRCAAIYTKHPWFLEATSSRESIIGPNELSWMEAALAMLAESGLGPRERHHAFLAVIGLVRGHATFQQIGKRPRSRREWNRELGRMLQSECHRYPILLDVVRSGGFSEDAAGAFEFGLSCILEGIRLRVSGRSR